MTGTFNAGKIPGKDTKTIMSTFGLTLDMTIGEKPYMCSFNWTGILISLHHQGDICPIGDGIEVIVNPELHIYVYEDTKNIMYRFQGNAGQYPMGKGDVLRQIFAQHDQAETAYEKLTSTTLEPEQEARKNMQKEMLKNIIDYDRKLYQEFEIRQF